MVKLPLKRKKGRVFIEPQLAENIVPSEVKPGLSLASLVGELEVKDNVYTIKVFKLLIVLFKVHQIHY